MLHPDELIGAVKRFADVMLERGRGPCGTDSPLFPGQLNAGTLCVPSGKTGDEGVFADNPEVAGCGPHCCNLLFELGLLDALKLLTELTGEGKYDEARREHLEYLFARCRHPLSGYIPWGEHVGYDAVEKRIVCGARKGFHEVKGNLLPWEDFWEISPETVQNEIGEAFFNHIIDLETFAFNRHAPMDGTKNSQSGVERCSLADSGGTFLYAWAWLYRKTGEKTYLDRARKIDAFYSSRRFPETGLFGTDEDRYDESWYQDALPLAVYMLAAHALLGDEWGEIKSRALSYFHAFYRCANDAQRDGFYDTFNVKTGRQVVGLSPHIPAALPKGYEQDYVRAYTRPDLLMAWDAHDNSGNLVAVAVCAAAALMFTADEGLLKLFAHAVRLLDIEGKAAEGSPIRAGKAAGMILSLLHVYRRTGEEEYFRLAGILAEHALGTAMHNGVFTTGIQGLNTYYAIRAGSDDLASAVLAYAAAASGRLELIPPIRDLYGILPW